VLSITKAAARVIDELADASPADVAGLRVTQREDSAALTMGLVEEPHEHDAVVGQPGTTAVVFLDPVVLPRLDDAVLDVKTEPGSSAFFLR
jgi:Fe-S cluster assembly iron-binding protein IscA